MLIKRLGALGLMAAIAAALLTSAADAHSKPRRTKTKTVGVSDVTLGFTDQEPTLDLGAIFPDRQDFFSGTISRVKDCDGRQVVEVFRVGGAIVGTTLATANGDWVLQAEDPGSGNYFAKVTGSNKRGNKVCARGTSAEVAVEDASGDIADV